MKPHHHHPLGLVRSTNIRGLCTITFCTITFCIIAAGQVAHAASPAWSGTSSNLWSVGGAGGNWTGAVAPLAGDTLNFGGNAIPSTSNDLAVNTSFAGINFTNDLSTGKTANFTLGGAAITLAGNITTSARTVGSGTLNDVINLAMILDTPTMTVTTNGNHNLAINGDISEVSGPRALTKAGSSNLILTGNNTYTGITTLSAGTLQVNNSSNGLGNSTATDAITLNGGTLSLRNNGAGNDGTIIYGSTGNASGYNVRLGASTTINVANLTANTGNTIQLGNLTQTTSANKTINVTGGNGYSLTLSNLETNGGTGNATTLNPTTANLIITGNVTNPMSGFAGGGVNFNNLTLSGTSTGNRIGGVISDAVGVLANGDGATRVTKNSSTAWTLNGTGSTYSGLTHIQNGTLEVKALRDTGTASSIGTGSATGQSVILIGDAATTGILLHTGAASSTNRQIQIGNNTTAASTGGATIRSSGTGSNILEFTNAAFNTPVATGTGTDVAATTRTLTLGGTNTGLNRIAGVIADNSGTETPVVALTKEDAGQWILEGANTYSGATSVTGGTLRVNGTHISATSGSGYTVSNTDTTLGGNGRLAINGNVSVGSGAILAPGASIGTLTLDGANTTGNVLTMTTGSKLDFELAGNGDIPDRLDFWNYVAGDLVLNTNTLDLSLMGTQAAGTYNVDIFRFFSDGGGTAATHAFSSGLNIGTLGTGISGATIDWDGTGDNNQTIALTYTVVPEPHAALLGGLGLLALLRRRRCN